VVVYLQGDQYEITAKFAKHSVSSIAPRTHAKLAQVVISAQQSSSGEAHCHTIPSENQCCLECDSQIPSMMVGSFVPCRLADLLSPLRCVTSCVLLVNIPLLTGRDDRPRVCVYCENRTDTRNARNKSQMDFWQQEGLIL
jgi:hypothetical protein